jgi:hypothetical protein
MGVLVPGFPTLISNLLHSITIKDAIKAMEKCQDEKDFWIYEYRKWRLSFDLTCTVDGLSNEIYRIKFSTWFIGMTFIEAADMIFCQFNIILYAVTRECQLYMNPGSKFIIRRGDLAVCIASNIFEANKILFYENPEMVKQNKMMAAAKTIPEDQQEVTIEIPSQQQLLQPHESTKGKLKKLVKIIKMSFTTASKDQIEEAKEDVGEVKEQLDLKKRMKQEELKHEIEKEQEEELVYAPHVSRVPSSIIDSKTVQNSITLDTFCDHLSNNGNDDDKADTPDICEPNDNLRPEQVRRSIDIKSKRRSPAVQRLKEIELVEKRRMPSPEPSASATSAFSPQEEERKMKKLERPIIDRHSIQKLLRTIAPISMLRKFFGLQQGNSLMADPVLERLFYQKALMRFNLSLNSRPKEDFWIKSYKSRNIKNHILVLGSLRGAIYIALTVRGARQDLQKPIIFMAPDANRYFEKMYDRIRFLDGIYFMTGSTTDRSDLRKAGFHEAEAALYLMRSSEVSGQSKELKHSSNHPYHGAYDLRAVSFSKKMDEVNTSSSSDDVDDSYECDAEATKTILALQWIDKNKNIVSEINNRANVWFIRPSLPYNNQQRARLDKILKSVSAIWVKQEVTNF